MDGRDTIFVQFPLTDAEPAPAAVNEHGFTTAEVHADGDVAHFTARVADAFTQCGRSKHYHVNLPWNRNTRKVEWAGLGQALVRLLRAFAAVAGDAELDVEIALSVYHAYDLWIFTQMFPQTVRGIAIYTPPDTACNTNPRSVLETTPWVKRVRINGIEFTRT